MNNHNIKYWDSEGYLYAQWGDCALDDDDRDKGILIEVKVPVTEDSRLDMKAVKTALNRKYDEWIRETR